MKIIIPIVVSCLFFVNIYGQNFSNLFDNELGKDEVGYTVKEDNGSYYAICAVVCLTNNRECFNVQKFTSAGELLWNIQVDWMDVANWESLLISNDTLITAGHSNGTTNLFGRSFLLHRMTLEGDSLDTFEYSIEQYGYSSGNSFGVIEFDNEYFIYGDARRVKDQHAVGIILQINKCGKLIRKYEYEGGILSHVFSL